MKQTKRAVSLLLVMTMIIAMFTICTVPASAADPQDIPLLGDVDRNGRITVTDALQLQQSLSHRTGSLDYRGMTEDDIEFRIANTYHDSKIDAVDVFYIQLFCSHDSRAQDKGIGEPIDMPENPTEAPTSAPTESATEAPTFAPGKATVTVHGLNGQSNTREFNVGDTFTVYTTLDASAASEGGKIAAINGIDVFDLWREV